MTFSGKILAYGYFYPLPSTPVEGPDFGAGDLAVIDDVEVTAKFFSIDVGSSYIRFEFSDTGVFQTTGTFNGAVFEDTTGAINSMSRVRLQTNMSGLSRDDISVRADELTINFAGAAFTEETYVHIQVVFAANIVQGTAASETLVGTGGADKIKGKGGDDVLLGDASETELANVAKHSVIGEADWLSGGGGADRFVFATGDTARQREKADVITDFREVGGETIDLTKWDADEIQTGHQQFAFVGKEPFSGNAGELRYAIVQEATFIEGDTNGDRRSDFSIRLVGACDLTDESFLL